MLAANVWIDVIKPISHKERSRMQEHIGTNINQKQLRIFLNKIIH